MLKDVIMFHLFTLESRLIFWVFIADSLFLVHWAHKVMVSTSFKEVLGSILVGLFGSSLFEIEGKQCGNPKEIDRSL